MTQATQPAPANFRLRVSIDGQEVISAPVQVARPGPPPPAPPPAKAEPKAPPAPAKREETLVELHLLDRKGGAPQAVKYELEFADGEKLEGWTKADGSVRATQPGKHEKVTVRFQPPGAPARVERLVWLDPGDVSTDEGVKRRLHNLGYDVNELSLAVRAFEEEHGLVPDGTIDDMMRRALKDSHDHGGAAKSTVYPAPPGGNDQKNPPAREPDDHPPVALQPVTDHDLAALASLSRE